MVSNAPFENWENFKSIRVRLSHNDIGIDNHNHNEYDHSDSDSHTNSRSDKW